MTDSETSKAAHKGLLATGMVAIAVGVVLVLCSCSAYKVAWGTTASVASARNAVDEGIGKAFDARLNQCVKDSGGDCKEKCQQCVKGSQEYAAIMAWRTFGRPVVNASLRATVTALTIAEKVKADPKKAKWMDLLKDAFCGLAKVIAEFKDLFPKQALTALGYLDTVKGLVCK